MALRKEPKYVLPFEAKVKAELAGLLPESSCCCWSELAGWARVASQVAEGKQGKYLIIKAQGANLARKAYRLLRAVLGETEEILVDRAKGSLSSYRLKVHLTNPALLVKLGLKDRWGRKVVGLRKSLLRRECCRRAYLRGLFLGGGWIGVKGGYQLELELPTGEAAQETVALLQRLGVRARRHSRRPKVVYLKQGGAVAECLRLMGASASLLELENTRILREVRGQVNRLVNCETANLARTVEAALSRRKEIEQLIAWVGLENLPAPLREVAELRLRYPEATLKELGELLHPPVSKSCVNHRLRRLAALARELKKEG
ncbi:DNA-binding protein WhiA [Ammonifex thiophilus]|uniref:Probable cell division protein WhiA n=1 Tax=Ammonifex thiophilus TaxID=444093 RepID=A0A3D8P2R4_9THEO|nr:DNA-binding protein WhiA [Ammonifex thiophilus]RDV82855.1 DNA-binding protein WhiA [Ammonifex thiophilus]